MTKYVKVLIFQQFFASINKIFFWEEDWSLSYSFMKFRDFPDLSQFSRVQGLFSCVGAKARPAVKMPKIKNLKLFGNS